ncbi:transglutaminase domain-containing protein [Candidatus Saccharibacteria bacterium]|nr:transglutaminase domain-containing protein [Candidatus Saccharibacteria bacterium]
MRKFGQRFTGGWLLQAAAIGLLILYGLMATAVPQPSRAAAEFANTVDIKYEARSDGVTRVTETYAVTNQTANKYLNSIQLSAPTDQLTNLTVNYGDGASIPYTTAVKAANSKGYSYNYQQILINFNRQNAGLGNRWSFVVSFDTTKLVESQGSARTVYIPSVAADASVQYKISLVVPDNFGPLHTTGPRPVNAGSKDGFTTYNFDQTDIANQSLSLVFGDSTVYDINFNFPLNNDSNTAKTLTVTLPPTTSAQKVYINRLEPQPSATRLDAEGNILADYMVPPRTRMVVKTSVAVVVKYLDYNLVASGTKADIPAELVGAYTSPQPYWQANNPAIIQKANELTKGKDTVAKQVQAINDYVVSRLSYNSEKIKYNIRQGALKAFENPNNVVCLEYSDLTIALLRAAGIPARMPIGYGYSGNLKPSSSVSDSLHSWVEAYVPGVGWMNVDPTWAEKFQNFGTSDLAHVAFAIWGKNNDSPTAVMQNGQDINYQYEATTISYQQAVAQLPSTSQISVSKYAVLPFVSLINYSLQAPQNAAGDNYYLEITEGSYSQRVKLGSLAPAQKISSVAWGLSIGFLNPSTVKVLQTGNNSLMLATTQVSSQWWPLVVFCLILAGIVIYLLVKSRHTKRKLAQAKQTQAQAVNRLHEIKNKPKTPESKS